jgi:hypothetical protein
MKAFKRPSPHDGITKGTALPGDRPVSGKEYRRTVDGQIVRKWPKLRGKAARKALKRKRHQQREYRIAA